jgi:FecR protein
MSIFHRLAASLPYHRAFGFRLIALTVSLLVPFCSALLADEPIIRAARISLVEGEVNYQRANDPDKDWFDATANLPLHENDHVYSGPDGRAELQLSGRNIVRINHSTNLRFTQFNTGVIQLALPVGTATFRIDSLDRGQFQVIDAQDSAKGDPVHFEVDSPVIAITFLKEGNYRVNVSDDGTTEVLVVRGQAEVFNQELGTISVKEGRRFVIDGGDKDNFRVAKVEDKDEWDRWNDGRDDELTGQIERSSGHVPSAVPGVYDLDNYGDWIESPDYGSVWSPRDVAPDWAPYRDGCWRWYSSYGWTWVSHERWGWVPYHYGRWVHWRNRWCWIPRPVHGAGPGSGWNWAPHLTIFFGWGNGGDDRAYREGYRDGYRDGRRNWMGWCPLGPGEAYHRGSHRRAIEALRNYRSPGGLNVIERRNFDHRRIIVKRDVLIVPARFAGRGDRPPIAVNADEFKPPRKAPTRNAFLEKAGIARKLKSPVVVRRVTRDSTDSIRPLRPNYPSRGPGVGRDGVPIPIDTNRGGSRKAGDSTGTSPSRNTEGQIRRPVRVPDFSPAERIKPPDWRARREEKREERREEKRNGEPGSASGDQTRPGRNVDRPSRPELPTKVEPDHKRDDSHSMPRLERRESPRNERESSAPTESHGHDRAPVRESTPSGNFERPSPPAPPRVSAPPRPVERPSPPRPRESAPSRPAERPSSPAPPRVSAPPRPVERPSSPPPRVSAPSRPAEHRSPPARRPM